MKIAETKTVSLRHLWGREVAQVEIPNEMTGPDIIEYSGKVYVRKTHDVYHEATRLIVEASA